VVEDVEGRRQLSMTRFYKQVWELSLSTAVKIAGKMNLPMKLNLNPTAIVWIIQTVLEDPFKSCFKTILPRGHDNTANGKLILVHTLKRYEANMTRGCAT